MTHIDFFKKQAKNLLKDWKTCKATNQTESCKPRFFNIDRIIKAYKIDDNFCLQKAQNIIATIAGFENWNDFLNNYELSHEGKQNYENNVKKFKLKPGSVENQILYFNYKEVRKMSKYYATFDDKGFLCGVGKSKSEALMEATDGLESEDSLKFDTIACSRELYEYCKVYEEYPDKDMISIEYDGNSEICYLAPPVTTVGQLKSMLEYFSDEAIVDFFDIVKKESKSICHYAGNEGLHIGIV